VDASGQVVGTSKTAGDAALHAFLWTTAGGMIDLGTLGGTHSFAVGVNASGQIIGSSDTPGFESHAFSWTAAGGMVDLGTLGGRFTIPVAVNASGQVVGFGLTAGNCDARVLVECSGGHG